MDRTVRQHVEWLEERQQAPNNTLMTTDTHDKANAVESEIRAVRLALTAAPLIAAVLRSEIGAGCNQE